MYRFNYSAYNMNGELIKAVCVCKSEAEFLDYADKNEILLSDYKKKELSSKGKKINSKELMNLSYFLSRILKSGIPIIRSLELFGKECNNKKLKRIIELLRLEMLSGKSMYQSLKAIDVKFPALFISMVQVGEDSGKLENIFKSLNRYYFHTNKLKKELVKKMSYPLFVILMTIIMYIAMKFYLLPQILSGLGNDMTVAHSEFEGVSMSLVIIILSLITVIVIKVLNKKHYENHLLNRINIIKNIRSKIFYCKFFYCLNIMFESGIDILKSLRILEDCQWNKKELENIKSIRRYLLEGNTFANSLDKVKIFKKSIITTMAIGEEIGNLENSSEIIYKENYEDLLGISEKIVSLIEPILLILVGIMILRVFLMVMVPLMESYDSLLQ